MKVIDLLNKIANNEEIPDKFMIKNSIYNNRILTYSKDDECFDDLNSPSYCTYEIGLDELNDEVEIIEDTSENIKIEKLDLSEWCEITSSEDCKSENLAKIFNKNAKAFSRKINEIIDKINEKEENNDTN